MADRAQRDRDMRTSGSRKRRASHGSTRDGTPRPSGSFRSRSGSCTHRRRARAARPHRPVLRPRARQHRTRRSSRVRRRPRRDQLEHRALRTGVPRARPHQEDTSRSSGHRRRASRNADAGRRREKRFDAAIIGEGEDTTVDLVEAIRRGTPLPEVAGAAAKKGDEVVLGPDRGFEPDLDVFPDPDRTLVDYPKSFADDIEFVGRMASRSCPYECPFCKPMLDEMHGLPVRRRSPKRIVQAMANIASSLGYKRFPFKDDMVPAGLDFFVDFERGLAAAGLPDSRWVCQARVDQGSSPLLERMKRCGVEAIASGVESGSQKILDFFRKGIEIERTIKAFDPCREYGIGTRIPSSAPSSPPATYRELQTPSCSCPISPASAHRTTTRMRAACCSGSSPTPTASRWRRR